MFLSWADDDIDAALEWQAAQDARCSGCGRPKGETFDPNSTVDYEALVLRCRACEVKDNAAKKFNTNGDPAGIYVAVTELDRPTLGGY